MIAPRHCQIKHNYVTEFDQEERWCDTAPVPKNKIARYRKKRNPSKDALVSLATGAGAGFAGYAVTRLLSRVVYSQAVQRFPRLANHAAVGTSAAGVVGTYLATRYWERAQGYQESATIGAGVALLQAVFQTYLPKFGWVVSDLDPGQYAPQKTTAPSTEPDLDLDSLLEDNPDMEAVEVAQIGQGGEEEPDEMLSWGVGVED